MSWTEPALLRQYSVSGYVYVHQTARIWQWHRQRHLSNRQAGNMLGKAQTGRLTDPKSPPTTIIRVMDVHVLVYLYKVWVENPRRDCTGTLNLKICKKKFFFFFFFFLVLVLQKGYKNKKNKKYPASDSRLCMYHTKYASRYIHKFLAIILWTGRYHGYHYLHIIAPAN